MQKAVMERNRRELLQLARGWCASCALVVMPAPFAHAQVDASDVDGDLARRIKAVSNVFEVGGAAPDYAYVEDLRDGRGYTVTQYGFCTYNTEVTGVINRYAAYVPGTPLKRFLSELPPAKWSDQALDEFPAAWREEIKKSKLLEHAIDEEADILFFNPAVEMATALGIRSPVGKAIIYDTLLQHGNGNDPDSLPAIIERTVAQHGSVESTSEAEFLKALLAVRRSVLENPANRQTQAAWRASVLRIDALLSIAENNPDLVPPIRVANDEIDVTIR